MKDRRGGNTRSKGRKKSECMKGKRKTEEEMKAQG